MRLLQFRLIRTEVDAEVEAETEGGGSCNLCGSPGVAVGLDNGDAADKSCVIGEMHCTGCVVEANGR